MEYTNLEFRMETIDGNIVYRHLELPKDELFLRLLA